MQFLIKTLMAAAIAACITAPDLPAAVKTAGTPLGGMGASYVVYDAATGKFTKGYRLSGQHWYAEAAMDAAFHLYTKVDGTVKTVNGMKADDENAYIPVYRVSYGQANDGIDVKLLAFGPYVTGDEKSSVMPLAFFEFTMKNNNSVDAEAAVAFEIKDLAGADPKRIITGNGLSWSGGDNSTVMAQGDATEASVTTGGDIVQFNASGSLDNTDGNIISVKAILKPSQSANFRFVLGWYQEFSAKNWNGETLDEGFYYQNFVKNSAEAAQYGMNEFTRIRNGAVSFVERIRAVNLPDWYTDRLLNNLYPLMHNSQFARDGRVAWREGKYYVIGTLDQQGYAQIVTSYNWPDGQWRQMEYWAKTQWQGENEGQVHHDFNGPESASDQVDAMCAWDDSNHDDYWWSRTKNWSDLNALFIVNSYELFLATGDTAKLRKIWSSLKLTGGRLLKQAASCIDNQPKTPPTSDFVLPYECLGTYDRDGSTNEYNASIALNAYSALKEMALAMGENDESKKWADIFARGKSQFSMTYASKSNFGTVNEGQLGVYNFSRHLGLPVIMSDAEAKTAFNRYWTKSGNGADLLPWHFYSVNHFGDMGISLGEVDKGLKVHRNDYDKFCALKPKYYFWQDLDDDYGMYSYVTSPVVWRSYLLISGFCMDKFNKRLWLRPLLPTENNGALTNAPLISPGNWGTMNYLETEKGKTQKISISFDTAMTVSELCLKDAGNSFVKVVGPAGEIACKMTKEGAGLDAVLRVRFDQPQQISSAGIRIGVDTDPELSISGKRPLPWLRGAVTSVKVQSCSDRIRTLFTLEQSCDISIDIFSVSGKKVAAMPVGVKSDGVYSVTSNRLAKGMYVVNLKSAGKLLASVPVLLLN